MSETAGHACPLRYRFGTKSIASAPVRGAEALYFVGGLYGNLPVLTTIKAMATRLASLAVLLPTHHARAGLWH